MSFITAKDILYSRQFGFREGYSTYMALLEFTSRISDVFENKELLIGLFIDISKAFDCINHNILSKKLEYYGIRGIPLKWLESYLSDRKQYVYIDNYKSNMCTVNVGVPQGSVLGPLLFLLFINDLQYVSQRLFSIIFADDTNLFISGKDINEMNHALNIELKSIHEWFTANNLVLNLKKTCYMIFKPKNKKIDEEIIKIYIDNHQIQRVTNTKFLGVLIDEKLTWSVHVNDICCKISRSIGAMNRLKCIIPNQVLLTLYYTMILPYIMYCCIIWGHSANYLVERVLKLQKRAIRIISNSKPFSHTAELFKKLKILKVSQIVELQEAIFMYLYFKKILPKNVNEIFKLNNSVHTYNTRAKNKIRLPLLKYEFSRKTIKFTGTKCWNKIPENIKEMPTLSSFKRNFKIYLLSQP